MITSRRELGLLCRLTLKRFIADSPPFTLKLIIGARVYFYVIQLPADVVYLKD
jgi:hypothetical protein